MHRLHSATRYRKLPVGRRASSGPTDDEVVAHQRARLHGAAIETVVAHGYGATTVRRVSELAGLSTRTLYELFPGGKQEWVLSAYDEAVRRAARRVAIAHLSGGDVDQRLARALTAFAEELHERPKTARFVLVEAFAAGEGARERCERTQRLFEGMVNLNFRAGGRTAPPPLLVKGVVAGIARVARIRALEGRTATMPALVAELLEWAQTYRSPTAAQLQELRGAISPAPPAGAANGHLRSPEVEPDRERFLDAVLELAVREGCAGLGVARVAATAGLSRRRFLELFPSAQACLFAALERHAARALSSAGAAFVTGGGWPGGLPYALASLCARVAAEPALARLVLVETLAFGSYGVRFREGLLDRFAASLRASAPPEKRPSSLVAEASAGAIWGVIYHHVLLGSTRRMAELTPDLSFLALAPVLGAEDALEAIAAARSAPTRTNGKIVPQLRAYERLALECLEELWRPDAGGPLPAWGTSG